MKIQFIQDAIDILRGKKKKIDVSTINFSKEYIAPQKTYKNLICTNGFGHSGSGVIIDLLSEFDNTTIFGSHDKDGGSPLSNDPKTVRFEIDFIRRYGGCFSLEDICNDSSLDFKNIKISNFINLIEYYFQTDIPIYNDKFLQLSYEFVEKLIYKKNKLADPLAANDAFRYISAFRKDYKNLMSPLLYGSRNNRYFYYVKNLPTMQYRTIAKEYLINFLNTIESKDNLILDGALSDSSADFDKYEDYIGNYKIITVYRDPRDVWMTGTILQQPWIPRDKEDFIFWFKNRYNIDKYLTSNDSRQLVLKFEDLVLNYDNSVLKILNFLNIDKKHHIAPKTQFRPEYSIKNIGLYRNPEYKDIMNYIYENLKDYCYEGEINV